MVAFELAGVWLVIATVFLTHCPHFALGQYLATPDDLNTWLRTTTANVEFIGSDFNTPMGPLDVRLIYCTERIENTTTCGGNCFAYQGPGSQCLQPVLRTANCLAATRSVHMCFTRDCNDCNLYTSCGTRLDDGFCFTPQTNSIRLPLYVSDIVPSSSSAGLSSTSAVSGSPSPSLSPTNQSSSQQSSEKLPVGAIVGIALGAVAIILATVLFVIWIRRRDKHQEMREANLHPPPAPYRGTGMPIATPPRPPMPAPAPSTISSSSSGWNAAPPPKMGSFAYGVSQSELSHATNPSFSSSDASSSLAFRRPAPAPPMHIIHEDSGERIRASFQAGQAPVEHPPPYSRA